jgi:inosine/xanthosine triphosphatase
MTKKNFQIIVASSNPVKIEAVSQAFHGLGISSFEISGITSPSDVSDQPVTDSETLTGARNRVNYIKSNFPTADFWIGIEGGIQPGEKFLEAFAWVYILWDNGSGQARTTSFQLPEKMARLIRLGYELGTASDMTFGEMGSKQKTGAVGLLTHDTVTRTQLYMQAVQLAMIPYLNRLLFDT